MSYAENPVRSVANAAYKAVILVIALGLPIFLGLIFSVGVFEAAFACGRLLIQKLAIRTTKHSPECPTEGHGSPASRF